MTVEEYSAVVRHTMYVWWTMWAGGLVLWAVRLAVYSNDHSDFRHNNGWLFWFLLGAVVIGIASGVVCLVYYFVCMRGRQQPQYPNW
jgi:hypothetical protein